MLGYTSVLTAYVSGLLVEDRHGSQHVAASPANQAYRDLAVRRFVGGEVPGPQR